MKSNLVGASHRLPVSIPECARMLGVSVRTIHRYCQYGILSYTRIGRRKLIRTADIIRLAEQGVSVERLRRVKAEMALNRTS